MPCILSALLGLVSGFLLAACLFLLLRRPPPPPPEDEWQKMMRY